MKSFYRMIGSVSYEQINDALAKIVQDEEHLRNKLRKETLDSIENKEIIFDNDKIQKLMVELNRDLTTSYERERLLHQFINLIKS